VKITKELRNCGASALLCSGSYVVSATGKPGDYLEYRIHFYNISSQSIFSLRVLDTLISITPFQEDSYAANKDFQVQCPDTTTVYLDKSSTATNTSSLASSPQVVQIDVMNIEACNLSQINPTEYGHVLFKVKIP
jgi:hypothetical protein